jgi:hypothetical protein
MAIVLKPPAPVQFDGGLPSVFLAGSIDLGAAEDWQSQFCRALEGERCVVLNPRRDEAQERATWIAMYFEPSSKAPITMLELGLFARTRKVFVCCPEGFWRKGNVDIVCARYGVETVPTRDALLAEIRRRVA